MRVRSLSAPLLLLALLVVAGLPLVGSPPVGAVPSQTVRHAGADRYETAVAISRTLLPAGGPVPVVLVATGENWPDGIYAGLAAAKVGTSVLLVRHDSIPPSTAAELQRLAPTQIVVLGGTAAVSQGVFTGLGAYAPVVDRIGGVDRYETAAWLMQAAFPPGSAPEAFVAVGTDFRHGLMAAAMGAFYGTGAPAFLVPPTGPLPASVASALATLGPFPNIGVVGDASAVSDPMVAELGAFGSPARFTGTDVYDLSVAVWAPVVANPGGYGSPGTAILATSAAFPDGLVGAALAGARTAPLFLSEKDCIPVVVWNAMSQLGTQQVVLLGGTAALGPAVEALTPCGGSAPPAPNPNPPPGPGPTPLTCDYLTIAEVEAAMGTTVTKAEVLPWASFGPQTSTFLGILIPAHDAYVCAWEYPVGAWGAQGGWKSGLVGVKRFGSVADAVQYIADSRTAYSQTGHLAATPPLGDEAFVDSRYSLDGLWEVHVRQGRDVVELRFRDQCCSVSLQQAMQYQTALVQLVLARL